MDRSKILAKNPPRLMNLWRELNENINLDSHLSLELFPEGII